MDYLHYFSLCNIAITSIVLVAAYIVYLYAFTIKKWKEPPKCLQDPDLGTHGFLKLEDIRIHYVEKGDRTKPLMLFLHGFPDFWYSWRYQLKEFSRDYWTVAVDLRGYGETDKPRGKKNYSMDILVQDVKQTIEGLGREKCVLIAHDWGGVIGWYFLNRYPEMVQRYVMINAPHFLTFKKTIKINPAQIKKSWYVSMFQLPVIAENVAYFLLRNNFRHLFVENIRGPLAHLTRSDIEAYQYTFRSPGRFIGPLNIYRANWLLFFKKQEPLSDHSVPGLIIFGEDDKFVVPEAATTPLKYVKNLEVTMLKNIGHFVHHYDPKDLNNLIANFVRKTE